MTEALEAHIYKTNSTNNSITKSAIYWMSVHGNILSFHNKVRKGGNLIDNTSTLANMYYHSMKLIGESKPCLQNFSRGKRK